MFAKFKDWIVALYGPTLSKVLLGAIVLTIIGLPLPIIAGFDIESRQFSENIPAVISYVVFALGIGTISGFIIVRLGQGAISCLLEEESYYGRIVAAQKAVERSADKER